MGREQTTIRLTIRMPNYLDEAIRRESARRGNNINQTMIYILNRYFKNQIGR